MVRKQKTPTSKTIQKKPTPKDVCMNSNKNYERTSEQLDGITTTVITTILTAFIISQNFLEDSPSRTMKAVGVFALVTMLLHFVSYVSAHYAQIYKTKEKRELAKYFGEWTHRINGLVYVMVCFMFVSAILIVVFK